MLPIPFRSAPYPAKGLVHTAKMLQNYRYGFRKYPQRYFVAYSFLGKELRAPDYFGAHYSMNIIDDWIFISVNY